MSDDTHPMKRLLNEIEQARQAREYVSPEEQAKYDAEEESWSGVADNLRVAVFEGAGRWL